MAFSKAPSLLEDGRTLTLNYDVELMPDLNPMAMEHIPAIDICEACIIITKNILTRVAQKIPPQYLEHQMLIVDTGLVMSEHLRKLQESIYEGKFQNLLFHFHVIVFNIEGFTSKPSQSTKTEIALFHWKDTSPKTLQNADLMHAVVVMVGILKSSLNTLSAKVKTAKCIELLQRVVTCVAQIKQNLNIVIPLMGVSTVAPGIGFMRFTIQMNNHTRERIISKFSLCKPAKKKDGVL
jgi:hypothetical protein